MARITVEDCLDNVDNRYNLVLLSSKESKELQTPQGKYHLREEIMQRINAVLPIPIVKNVYFTEFVVQ